jgi:DNA-binding transcriptional MocR family regulator
VEPLHALAGATGAWAFLRSVSKAYGPDLRVALMAGDETTVARVQGRQRVGTGWVSTILQRTVVELMTDPSAAALVARARASYEERREALLAALVTRGLPAVGRSGLNVWLPVADETVVLARLRDDGYAVAPGALYRLATPPAVRITISNLDLDGVEAFADAVTRAVVGAGARPGV